MVNLIYGYSKRGKNHKRRTGKIRADMVGVDPVYITRIEKHNRLPSIIVYLNIERCLNLPPTLRSQYYKQKNPEVAKHYPTYELDKMFNIGPSNSIHVSPVVRVLRFVNNYPLTDTKSFLIGLFKDLDPDYKLTDKEIIECTKILNEMARNNSLNREEFKKFYSKMNAVNNFLIPEIGDNGPEYLKTEF